MNIGFPLHFDNNGRTAVVGNDDHIRDLIGQVLFTNPGERVNRPDFGCGLLQLVFEPNSDELAVTTQFLVQGSLQLWLGELIEVNDVQVLNEDSRLQVSVTYTVRRTQEKKLSVFVK
jgi:uncharacterized protein